MQREIKLACALHKRPDAAFSVWVRNLPAYLDMGGVYSYGHFCHYYYRHKISLQKIVEGEHWVKVKPFEDKENLDEVLPHNES